jgi:autotransporter-associated beta strand protein
MVAAGATLDLAGSSLVSTDLTGAGSVIDSGAAETWVLDAANFSGAISGALSLVANGAVTLSGNNTYTGATTIESGGTLQLGDGGAAGSINGALGDSGELAIDHDNALTFTNAIGGDGSLEQLGTGVTTITTANNYTGGTTISAGMLAIGAADALGTGAIEAQRRRTSHDRERDHHRRAQFFRNVDHRRRARNDAKRKCEQGFLCGEYKPEYRRAGGRRHDPLAYQ